MRKTYKILAICPFFLPKLHPEVIVNAKLFLGLMEHGHDVDVLTVHDHNDNGYTYSTADESWWEPLASHIHRVDQPASSRWNRFFSDALGFLETGYHYRGIGGWRRELDLADQLLRAKKYDCILYRGPGSMGVPAIKAAKKYHLPLIMNLSDPWYNFPPPYIKEKNLRFKQFMASKILGHADAVTFPSQQLADYSRKEYPVLSKTPCRIVPHMFRDISGAESIPTAPSSMADDTNTFTLTHAGSWGLFRNPLRLFKALKKVAESNLDLHFRFLVIGKANPDFERMVEELGIGEIVQYLGSKTYEETLALLKSSTVLALLEAECEVGIFMPSKFVDYLQAGRPILAISPKQGCIAENIRRFHVGELSDVRSEEEIVQALQRLVDAFRNGKLTQYDPAEAVEHFSTEPVHETEELIAQLTAPQDTGKK